MPDIPKDYPFNYSDDEILKYIEEYSELSLHTGLAIYPNLIQRGQDELAKRVQERYLKETEKLSREIGSLRKSNKQFSRSSVMLNVITIVLAVLTGVIGYFTLNHAKKDLVSDEDWQLQQSELLMIQIEQNEQLLSQQLEIVNLIRERSRKE